MSEPPQGPVSFWAIRLGRREALQWLSASLLYSGASWGGTPPKGPEGTAWDPDLFHPKTLWKRVLLPAELVALSALCDEILPADYRGSDEERRTMPKYLGAWVHGDELKTPKLSSEQLKVGMAWLDERSVLKFSSSYQKLTREQRQALHGDISPSATQLGVPDFIDEWVSAPYDFCQKDRKVIVKGLSWLDAESVRRHQRRFSFLADDQRDALCSEICFKSTAAKELSEPAAFFALVRNLTSGAYFSTRLGMRDVGYVGNVVLARYEGPSPEVLARLHL